MADEPKEPELVPEPAVMTMQLEIDALKDRLNDLESKLRQALQDKHRWRRMYQSAVQSKLDI